MSKYYLMPITEINNYNDGEKNYLNMMFPDVARLLNQIIVLSELRNVDGNKMSMVLNDLSSKLKKQLDIIPSHLLFKEVGRTWNHIILEEYFTKLKIKDSKENIMFHETTKDSAVEYIDNLFFTDKMLILDTFPAFVNGINKREKAKIIEFKR